MDDQTDLRSYYRKLGEQLLEMHLHLLDFPTQVTFTAEQWKEHTRQFTEMLNNAIVEGKDAPGGIVFRHGLFAMRIAALLTVSGNGKIINSPKSIAARTKISIRPCSSPAHLSNIVC